MTARSTVRLFIAETAGIAINVAGLGLWFYDDYSPNATMLLYAIGSVSAALFAIVTFLLAVPGRAADGSPQAPRKWKTVRVFSLIAFPMLGVLWVFIAVFLFLMPHEPIELDRGALLIALSVVVGFQFAESVVDALAFYPISLQQAEIYLSKQGMGQTAVLYFGVFIGVVVAAIFGESWFAVPLFAFKLVIDIAQPIQTFFGGGESYDDPNANLFRAVKVRSGVRRA